jgi:hypothetical protein
VCGLEGLWLRWIQMTPTRNSWWRESSKLLVTTLLLTGNPCHTGFFFIRAWSICPRCTAAYRLIVWPLSPPPNPCGFRCSHFRHQAPPRPYDARDPSSKRWNCGQEWWLVILPKCRLPCYIQGPFTCRKSATWDRRLYFPSEGRCAEDFFALKNPDGFGQVWTCELGYLKAARYP